MWSCYTVHCLTSKVLTCAKVGGTPGRLLFSEIFRVLRLFKFPISAGRERSSFPVHNNHKILIWLLLQTHSNSSYKKLMGNTTINLTQHQKFTPPKLIALNCGSTMKNICNIPNFIVHVWRVNHYFQDINFKQI